MVGTRQNGPLPLLPFRRLDLLLRPRPLILFQIDLPRAIEFDPFAFQQPALFVNSWNEWTEGGPLLPQQKYGAGYLEELKKAMEAGPLPTPSGAKR